MVEDLDLQGLWESMKKLPTENWGREKLVGRTALGKRQRTYGSLTAAAAHTTHAQPDHICTNTVMTAPPPTAQVIYLSFAYSTG